MLLHTLILQTIRNYHPDDVEIWAIDYKAVEFDGYIQHRTPYFRVIAHDICRCTTTAAKRARRMFPWTRSVSPGGAGADAGADAQAPDYQYCDRRAGARFLHVFRSPLGLENLALSIRVSHDADAAEETGF